VFVVGLRLGDSLHWRLSCSIAIPLPLRLKLITLLLSACATNEFLHALSPALIDAIPLSMLSKLRNFLWLGSKWRRYDLETLLCKFWGRFFGLALNLHISPFLPRRSLAMNEIKLQSEPLSGRSVSSAVGEALRRTLVAHSDNPRGYVR